MSTRLDGSNSLSYLGVKPTQPPQLLNNIRRPTIGDNSQEIGTLWVVPNRNNPINGEVWELVDKQYRLLLPIN